VTDKPAFLGGAPIVDRARHRPWPIVTDEEKRRVAGVLDRGLLAGWTAPESQALEKEWAKVCQARHALLTHCGTSALEIGVIAGGIGEGDEVIVPAFSWVATPLCVLHAGAVPVFVDVDEATGLIDVAAIEAAITPRTKAIMPVHVHGLPAPMRELRAIADKHKLSIFEDAAQAHLATYDGKPVGAIGAWGAFSLQSSKNFSAGEGGFFVTNDADLAERANRARNFGLDVRLGDVEEFDAARPLDGGRALESLGMGSNFRGNEMMAAFARAQLARLPEVTARCQKNAHDLSAALRVLEGVLPPEVPAGRTHVFHKYRVRFDPRAAGVDVLPSELRDAIAHALRAEGCEVVQWQSQPLPAMPIFAERKGFGEGFPWSAGNDTKTDGRFPRTRKLLACSLVLFSQSCPLIAQDSEMVGRYADAFRRVWANRHEVVKAWLAKSP
jgi:dTDP-4-amino-4,6-dideoxygalactose transaminase